MSYDKKLIEDLEEKAKQIRRNTIECVGVGIAGHIGGSFSSADIVTALITIFVYNREYETGHFYYQSVYRS